MALAAVFVDGEYLRKVRENEFPDIYIDYSKIGSELCKRIEAEVQLLRTYYYDSMPFKSRNPDNKEIQIYEIKRKMLAAFTYFEDFQVRKGRCIRVFDENGNPRFLQKGIDTWLAIDLTRLSATGKIEHAILLAGDGDFVPPILAAKEEGVKIWLFHGQNFSRALFTAVDRRIRITRDLLLSIKR
jgi:uncharacterized LabA/DUF88 family protein